VKPKTTGQFLLNPATTRMQNGALCWRMFRDQVQVLLVTSRDTGRWIIPKGWPMPDLPDAEAAAREAWEEAGVEGVVSDRAVGRFPYDKVMGPAQAIPCIVSVFPLQVTRLRGRYPESKQRRRKWFTPEKAAKKVLEPELREIIQLFTTPPKGDGAKVVDEGNAQG
jgi:8-oxo-dGTP pyrophosphatase MutT (NUDIX family)